jgi:hypothetical protein
VPIGELVPETSVPLDLSWLHILSGAEVELVGLRAREYRLSASLADLGQRMSVLIDRPPRSGC